jgi:two-component system cell cycle sensor histidine kinase/response regulator CckA
MTPSIGGTPEGTESTPAGESWAGINILPDGVLLVDGRGRVQKANDVASDILGRRPADLVDARLADLFNSDELELGGWSTALMKCCPHPAAGYRFLQASGHRNDGATFSCELAISALASRAESARWVVTVRPTAHRDFHESRMRESVKMTALTDLAARVANDLNNQLAAVSGNLESVAHATRHLEGSTAQEIMAAREATQGAARIVRRLSTLANPAPSKRCPIDVADVVEHALSTAQKELDSTIAINTTCNHGGWMVSGDAQQLADILINCYLNARDAMPQGGLIVTSTHRAVSSDLGRGAHASQGRREYVRIDVTDTGVGIEPDILPRIFDPFFTTKKNAPGSGLGLASVYSILGQHEGGVAVESTVGVGTTVHIFLPRAVVTPLKLMGSVQPVRPSGSETILIIDDEAGVRRPTRRALEHSGYTVLEAPDGIRGLQLYRRERDRIGLVLLDIVMPNMSGWEVLAELRERAPSLPVVLVSGYPATDQPEDTVENGDAFLAKPFALEELLNTVRQLLDRCPAQ